MTMPPSYRRLAFLLCLAAFTFLPTLRAATRNPLDVIAAPSCEDRSPAIRLEPDPASQTSTHLANVHDGDFALYRALDFDSGVAAFRATVAGSRSGTLELHLDSPTGPLLGACPFQPSGGWDQWQDVAANVDHSQAGVRDVYLLFHAPPDEAPNSRALVNLRSFVFLKSTVTPTTDAPDLASRLDSPDNHEPQSDVAWGFPKDGFRENFSDDVWRTHWKNLDDLTLQPLPDSSIRVATSGEHPLFAYTPNFYLNQTDTGGEWRTFAEGTVVAELTADDLSSRPGLGFVSSDGKQAVYVTLDPEHFSLAVWRRLADGTLTLVRHHPKLPEDAFSATDPPATWPIVRGQRYTLRVSWSPYAGTLLTYLLDASGQPITSFRTLIDLPAARHPLLVNSGGRASFAKVGFAPTLDAWNDRWEWYKQPILSPDVCNPAVWRGPNSQMYMIWRKFGADTFHGIAKSDDGVHWTRVTDQAIKCTGDMTVLQDPFGDGKWYATPGGNNLPWWSSDGTDDFQHWNQTDKTIGGIHGHNRIQEIIDTKRYPQLKPIHFQDQDYRFIAYCEDWVHAPQPHSVVLLSNTLTDWVQPSADPVVPPSNDFWGEKGNAIGSAYPLPDGNILLSVCACTYAGYTGALEPSNVAAIASGTEPWKLLKKSTLPITPVSRENVWYQGPNFGTAFFYDDKQDTLFLYGGFHDYSIGVQCVRHFLHPSSDKKADQP